MKITYYRKNVYGKENIYIYEPAEALNISLLTGKKTINKMDMTLLKTLGVEFQEILTPNY